MCLVLLRDSHKFWDKPLVGQIEMDVVLVSPIYPIRKGWRWHKCPCKVPVGHNSFPTHFWPVHPSQHRTPATHLVHESAYEVDEANLQLGELSSFVPVHHGLMKETRADDVGAVSPCKAVIWQRPLSC